ncbi:hypothetical protein SynA1560_01342 [Synechococcus sp. A15-60]|nr:hypothetical protein SynA1560_01342 [Synechococcus sp. A15-60]
MPMSAVTHSQWIETNVALRRPESWGMNGAASEFLQVDEFVQGDPL